MHFFKGLLLCVAGVALPTLSQAATLVPVTPPPSAAPASTFVFGINNHNIIAGSFLDSAGIEHGFFGPLNGTYTTFDYGGTSIGTEPRAIDDDGDLNGFAADPAFAVGQEFLRRSDGTISTISKGGVTLDGVAQGLLKQKGITSTGDYIDPDTGLRLGYLAQGGVWQSDVTVALNSPRTSPRGMNGLGTIAGFFIDSAAVQHGFILGKGPLQVIDADASGTTALEGINKKELVSGQFTGADGNPHSFLYDNKTGVFTAIDIPDGSTLQQAWEVNDKGAVAVSTDVASYILCTRDVHCADGGAAIALGRSWKGKAGASLHYDSNGRTGVNPAKVVHPLRGARQ